MSRAVQYLSKADVEGMRYAGRMAAELLNFLGDMVKPGISTGELDREAEKWTKAKGGVSAPLGYHGFPKSICTSINEVICHGIPNKKRILKEGDIINIDVTPKFKGYHGDTSRTFGVGRISKKAQELIDVTERCLELGIAEVKPGARLGDIGAAIQSYAENLGFSVVRDFVGHGIGKTFHSEPAVHHYGTRGKGDRLTKGMCFTIEPMINEGDWKSRTLADNWTAITTDGKLSAQFEHTLMVTDDGCEIFTKLS